MDSSIPPSPKEWKFLPLGTHQGQEALGVQLSERTVEWSIPSKELVELQELRKSVNPVELYLTIQLPAIGNPDEVLLPVQPLGGNLPLPGPA